MERVASRPWISGVIDKDQTRKGDLFDAQESPGWTVVGIVLGAERRDRHDSRRDCAGCSRRPHRTDTGRPHAGDSRHNDVVGTVTDENAKEQVTKGEVINFLSRYPIPANENREQVYRDAVDSLINTKLLTIFLNRQKITVPPAKVDEELARLEQQLKADGRDLATALLEDNTSLDTVRKELENRIRWSEYVKSKATEAELKRYVSANRDLFYGTQVRRQPYPAEG